MRRLLPLLALLSCAATGGPQPITTAQLENAANDNSSWLSYGRDPFGQRFVPLAQISPANVARLRPAWVFAIGGDNLSPWSKRITARVERLMRFEGDQILPGDVLPPANAGGLLLNAMNIAPDLEAEFNEWYDKEHIPALAAVPGVLCARRFRGTGNRKYVALYHLETADVVESDEWKKARQSDWTSRLQPQFRDHLRLVLRRYVQGG